MKGRTDTISSTAAEHCKVQPRQPWDLIPLLGSFIDGSHGRVEAQARDPALYFASRKRRICGGLCGAQVKTLGLHSAVCVSPFPACPLGGLPSFPLPLFIHFVHFPFKL